ncbi:MAG: Sec-independent protein translocase protein TatCy [Bacteroidetes bacterium ADurb.Bin408]|nr:MAG: Sec-independent protein translocase protein TatCy [Bacteroidetes bacterium ADurb.Bin408]
MSYISTVSLITLIMGVVFQLPVLIYFITRAGLITPEFMRKNRKIIIVIIFITAAIITPPDVLSQFMVAIPMYILYEASIYICRKNSLQG